jgi:uncharacterized protein YheU (UPF0270 family)
MTDKLTLELDRDEAYLLLRVVREGLDNGCGDLEVDDEDRVMDIRDQLFNWLGENNEG